MATGGKLASVPPATDAFSLHIRIRPFTAFGNEYWSTSWNQPTASLPAMIFKYAISPYEDWHRQAWAAGLVLLGLILVVNIVARGILARGIAVPRS